MIYSHYVIIFNNKLYLEIINRLIFLDYITIESFLLNCKKKILIKNYLKIQRFLIKLFNPYKYYLNNLKLNQNFKNKKLKKIKFLKIWI